MPDPNFDYKRRAVPSSDCQAGDHNQCAGEESALWPDGESTVRRCSCTCHAIETVRLHETQKFSAIDRDIKQGKFTTVARATSRNMAQRIAGALNAYTADKRGQ
jgi:hypothetical protein